MLDTLYRHILSRALDDSNIDIIKLVCDFLAMGTSYICGYDSDTLEKLFNLPEGDVEILLRAIPSLVSGECNMKLYHKSFSDFLHDEFRAGEFYIEDDAIRAHTLGRCIQMIPEAASLESEFGKSFKGICTWTPGGILMIDRYSVVS